MLWEMKLESGDPHVPCLRDACTASVNADMRQFVRNDFFSELETEINVFLSPFTVKASDVPVNMKLEITDMQSDAELKNKYCPNSPALAAKMLYVRDDLLL